MVGNTTPKANGLLQAALKQYAAFDFYDADRFSNAAIEST